MINKKELIRYYILLITIVLSFTIILLSEKPILHVLAFWLNVFIAIIISRFDITHPMLWFSISFALYSTSYSLIYILGYPAISGYSKENTLLSLIALSVVLLIVGVKKYDIGQYFKSKNYTMMSSKSNKKITEFILKILLVVLIICIIGLSRASFNHKNELLSERNAFFILGVYCTRFSTFFCCLYMLLFLNIDRKKTRFFILSFAILITLFSLFTGERDAMLRFFTVTIVSLFITKQISKKMLIFLIPLGMLILILSRYFKYYFVSGVINNSIKEQSYIYSFLTSDFNSAGENLQILINNSWTKSLYGFYLIVIDFISPFIPGRVLINVGNWFNNTFYPGSYSRAFTLTGEGYIIGGILGIVTVFSILGFAIKLFYRKSIKNVYWLAAYIYSIPTIISAFRSTLGIITTALIRIVLFSIFIINFFNVIMNKKTHNKVQKK